MLTGQHIHTLCVVDNNELSSYQAKMSLHASHRNILWEELRTFFFPRQ